MTYTQLGIVAVIAVVAADLWIFRTHLVRRKVFWTAYAIIVFFQLITNGMFTGFGIVKYDGEAIIGSTSPASAYAASLSRGLAAASVNCSTKSR